MSKLPKTLELDMEGIERLPLPEEVKVWLRRLVYDLEEKYKFQFDHAEAGGFGTKNWKAKEADSDDVTNGSARAAGNLILSHRTNGTKFEIEA